MKLLHKGLILISVPLAFEIFFACGFGSLLQQSMELLEAEVRAKEIIAKTEKLEVLLSESSFIVGLRKLSRDKDIQRRFDTIWHDTDATFQKLSQLGAGHVPDRVLTEINAELTDARDLQDAYWNTDKHSVRVLMERIPGARQLVAEHALMMFKRHKATRQNSPIARLVLWQLSSVKQGPQLRNKISNEFKGFLAFGIIADLLIVVGLALFFFRNIEGRLRSLMQTTNRLASGKDLAPTIAGADEFAALDSMLHDTAARLIEVQRFKKQLLGVVCHELKAPLSAVQIMLSLILSQATETLGEKARFSVARALRSCNRLQLMVSDLLDLEVMTSGKVQLSPTTINCAAVADIAVDLVRGVAADHKVELLIDASDMTAKFDSNRITQVLVNLLSNAIKFSPENAVVRLICAESDGVVKFAVSDSGPGIPENLREEIFNAFAQAESAKGQARMKGTGLGLAICKTIIDAHGGTISVSTNETGGATFSVSLPQDGITIVNSAGRASSISARPVPGKTSTRCGMPIRKVGLILIGVPLVAELAMVGALAFALSQAGSEIERQAAGREVALVAQKVIQSTADEAIVAMVGRGAYAFDFAFAEQRDELKAQISRLQVLGAGNAERQLTIAAIKKAVTSIEHDHEELVKDSKTTFRTAENVEPEMVAKYLGYWQDLTNSATALAEHEESLKTVNKGTLQSVAQNLDKILVIGVTANLAIAGGLALFLSRGISRRIGNVGLNAQRLLDKEPLVSPLAGNDEIAYLDQAFHDAADALGQERKLKQRLMAIASHELRTPLTSILSNLELLSSGAMGELPQKTAERVCSAQRGTERLITLINDILDIEKIEAGRFVLNRRAVPPSEFINRAIACVQALADEKGIGVRIAQVDKDEVDAASAIRDDVAVHADSERIVQVLLNLLSNAIKYSSRGQVVTVNTRLTSDGQLVTTVSDSGSGIPEELHDRIFERFISVDNATGGNSAGSGLGLPISKAIVEQHGGAIGFESRSKRGAEFWFSLPLSAAREVLSQ